LATALKIPGTARLVQRLLDKAGRQLRLFIKNDEIGNVRDRC